MPKNVAGGIPGVSVQNFTQPTTGCWHDYSVSPDDMKKLVGADLLVINGAGMESFLTNIIKQYPKMKLVDLSEGN